MTFEYIMSFFIVYGFRIFYKYFLPSPKNLSQNRRFFRLMGEDLQ